MHKLMTLGYIKKGGKTLMMQRTKDDIHKGKWNGLGGKFEPGETPEECIAREIFEECGLMIRNPMYKGRIVFTDKQPDSANNAHVYLFVITDFEGEINTSSPEGHLEWIDDEKIESLYLWDGDKVFMPWLKENSIFSAKLIYNGEKLVEHQVVFY